MPRLFEDETIVVTTTIVSGDTDVDFIDSVDIADALSGTLGPVNAEDSVDLTDKLVVDESNVQDSVAIDDALASLEGLDVGESILVDDELSGTLGPVNAEDSLGLEDLSSIEDFRIDDSVVLGDAFDAPDLSATAQDSILVDDQFGAATTSIPDSLATDDQIVGGPTIDDSVDISDVLPLVRVSADDTIDIATAIADTLMSTQQGDSLDIADLLRILDLRGADSIDLGDARTLITLNATIWANALVSNTGFTDAANLHDTSETSQARLSATGSSGLPGTFNSVTTNGTIVVSFPDPGWTPDSVTSAAIQYKYGMISDGGLNTTPVASISMNIDYSRNDGGAWTTLETVTDTGGTGTEITRDTSLGATTWSEILGFRFRCTGSVTSGASLLTAHRQVFDAKYCRLVVVATETP